MKTTKLRGCVAYTQLASFGSVLNYGINAIGYLSVKVTSMIFYMEGTGGREWIDSSLVEFYYFHQTNSFCT